MSGSYKQQQTWYTYVCGRQLLERKVSYCEHVCVYVVRNAVEFSQNNW